MNDDHHHHEDLVVLSIYNRAAEISEKVIRNPRPARSGFTERLDNLVTSPLWGLPLMSALLALLFWITISGANYPSDLLAHLFQQSENLLTLLFTALNSPPWLHGILVLGLYRGLTWVISVMLPPMAIFFPLFTFLEDFGLLPRLSFNLDHLFQKAGAHGKQALTMAMGFGCNAAGVVAARIIDSPRERLLAIITNSLVPCNGRFPMLLITAGVLVNYLAGTHLDLIWAAFAVLGAILLGTVATLLVSKLLTATVLRGHPSFFALELPPYRRPRLKQVLVRSFLDRTLFVLKRAVIVAAPAGILTWILANTVVGDASLISHSARILDPLGKLMGLDGVIILAFILGLPANEIVIPIMFMAYLAQGTMLEPTAVGEIPRLLAAQGWNWLTALNFMIFTLFHWPCGTTLLTVKKETGSWRWTYYAAIIPTVLGIILCILIAQGAALIL